MEKTRIRESVDRFRVRHSGTMGTRCRHWEHLIENLDVMFPKGESESGGSIFTGRDYWRGLKDLIRPIDCILSDCGPTKTEKTELAGLKAQIMDLLYG